MVVLLVEAEEAGNVAGPKQSTRGVADRRRQAAEGMRPVLELTSPATITDTGFVRDQLVARVSKPSSTSRLHDEQFARDAVDSWPRLQSFGVNARHYTNTCEKTHAWVYVEMVHVLSMNSAQQIIGI